MCYNVKLMIFSIIKLSFTVLRQLLKIIETLMIKISKNLFINIILYYVVLYINLSINIQNNQRSSKFIFIFSHC